MMKQHHLSKSPLFSGEGDVTIHAIILSYLGIERSVELKLLNKYSSFYFSHFHRNLYFALAVTMQHDLSRLHQTMVSYKTRVNIQVRVQEELMEDQKEGIK